MHLCGGIDMRHFIYGLLVAGMPLAFSACTQSVQEAREDVHEAQQDAMDRIAREQRDVQDAVKSGQDTVIQEQRELQDAARAEEEKLIKEQRDLEDAKRREADRAADRDGDA